MYRQIPNLLSLARIICSVLLIVFVHTIANKVSGVIVYFLPIILILSQNSLIILILLALVLMAAVEELLISIRFQEVNLNRTSLFSKNKHNGEY